MPESWRRACDSAVFRKEQEEDLVNCTAVSFTSVPGKVLEQFGLDAFCEQLERKKFISSMQLGFTEEKSCSTNPAAFYNGITAQSPFGDLWPAVFPRAWCCV